MKDNSHVFFKSDKWSGSVHIKADEPGIQVALNVCKRIGCVFGNIEIREKRKWFECNAIWVSIIPLSYREFETLVAYRGSVLFRYSKYTG